jgi:cardiolipin synthase A/B
MKSWDTFIVVATWLVGAAGIVLGLIASGHAILYKRDPRATAVWVIVICIIPLAGACAYFLLGINRIRRHALTLRGAQAKHSSVPSVAPCSPGTVEELLPAECRHIARLSSLVNSVVARPLLPGNRVQPLCNGDLAYPRMLEAIRGASKSVSLATYIFDNDEVGHEFAEALGAAMKRGVAVRVLIDDAGLRYSWPSMLKILERRQIPTARFLPTLAPWKLTAMNLRNHRKIMVIDGHLGFTGGMNLRAGHRLSHSTGARIQDLHFQVEGPVVAHLQETFVDDWEFATGETLRGEDWFPSQACSGAVLARGISDGPDEDFEKLRWTLLGALTAAHRSIVVVTPYFLPDSALISALNLAAMRGVEVDIVLPEKNNFPVVQWAMAALLWQVLERGCRVWLSPPPFDHSKALIVDRCWSLIGSANWDPRSLRLNFEFNLECYDLEMATALSRIMSEKIAKSRALTLADVDRRPLPIRLRDGTARLLTPFM